MSGNGVKVRRRKVTDYQPDPANANRSTARGREMIADSFRDAGAGRSIVVDADDTIIAGNHAVEGAAEAGITDVIEVETDGRALVVVKRKDLDLDGDDGTARRLAYADNRAGETSLDWNPAQIRADLEGGIDFDGLFRDDELDAMLKAADVEALVDSLGDGDGSGAGGKRVPGSPQQIRVVLAMHEVAVFEQALDATGLINRGEALLTVCRSYLEGKEAST